MLLAIDVGNTNVTVGVFRGDVLLQTLRFATQNERTVDDYAGALLPLLAGFPEPVTDVVLAGVAAGVAESWRRLVEMYLGIAPLVVTPTFPFGFAIAYEPPASVGVDRLVNVFAAHNLAEIFLNETGNRGNGAGNTDNESAPRDTDLVSWDKENRTHVKDSRSSSDSSLDFPVIVVDFGTATTMDVLTRDAIYVGGAIWPGLATAFDALRVRTNLPRVPLLPNADTPVVGATTAQSLQSGLLHGEAARTDGMIAHARAVVGDDARVVLTGGWAAVVAPLCRTPGHTHAPDLTLRGLLLAYRVHQNSHATKAA